MTTDDAIKALENRASTGHPEENCSSFSFGAPIQIVNEALYMAIAALQTQQEMESQKPLTLDELCQMDGEPVWLECTSYPEQGGWEIVLGVEFMLQKLFCRGDKTFLDYGNTWITYRNKPKDLL